MIRRAAGPVCGGTALWGSHTPVLRVWTPVSGDARESIRARACWLTSHWLALGVGTTSASDVAWIVVVIIVRQRCRNAGCSGGLHSSTRSGCSGHPRSWTAHCLWIILVVAFNIVKSNCDSRISRLVERPTAHSATIPLLLTFCPIKPFLFDQVHSIPGRAGHGRPWRLHNPACRETLNCCLLFLWRGDILARDSSYLLPALRCHDLRLLHEAGENFKPFIVRHPGAGGREGSCRRHGG